MSFLDDFERDMFGLPLDDSTADAILEGRMPPDDAPPGLQQIASYVQMARGAALPDELVDETVVVSQVAATVGARAHHSETSPQRRTQVLTTLRRLHLERAVPVIAVAVLGCSAVAAAATGTFIATHRPDGGTPTRLHESTSLAAPATGHHSVSRPAARPSSIKLGGKAVDGSHTVSATGTKGAAKGGGTSGKSSSSRSSAAHLVGEHHRHARGVFGDVSAVTVNDVTSNCGTAATAGSFTLTNSHSSASPFTVDVTTTTTFKDPSATSPSFADVCDGDDVVVVGTVSSSTITATSVFVVPPPSSRASGEVSGLTVNGVTSNCGTAATAGSFTLTSNKGWGKNSSTTTTSVDVTTTTTFKDQAVTSPSFADVCDGDYVTVTGTSSAGTLTATSVTVLTGGGHRHHHGNGNGNGGWGQGNGNGNGGNGGQGNGGNGGQGNGQSNGNNATGSGQGNGGKGGGSSHHHHGHHGGTDGQGSGGTGGASSGSDGNGGQGNQDSQSNGWT